ncbi:MAG TPA: guanylate kinase [Anaerolineaceae bacterium]|jgi:guanylate kinase
MVSNSTNFTLPQPEPLILVISGPSGVGKDSVIKRLKERLQSVYVVVTATTRPPREGEQDGVDYFFLSREQFTEMIARDALLEHTLVYEDYKGIPKDQIRRALASGKDVILRVDVQGAATVHAMCQEAILIFLSPRSEDELIRRLEERKSETDSSLALRIQTAREEMARLDEYDYVVENIQGHLDRAVDAIVAIITAEHSRVHQRKASL